MDDHDGIVKIWPQQFLFEQKYPLSNQTRKNKSAKHPPLPYQFIQILVVHTSIHVGEITTHCENNVLWSVILCLILYVV